MSSEARQVFAELSRPGPHEVLRGELALVGLPGVVCTPKSGLGLPAVVFGHGWLQPSERYHGLLRHLASWGIVAASPSTQQGPLASHRLYAADLRTALDVCVGVRLGDGEISVDPAKLGLAGHSTGGGAAVLAAADDERVRAVATISAAEVRPSALDAAARCRMPGLHLVGDKDLIAPRAGHGEAIAEAWGGPVTLRSLPKATHLGVTEGRHWSQLLLDGKPERATQRAAKGLLTAFFLVHLAGRREYQPLLDESVRRCPIELSREPVPATTKKR
ncbi:MAG TPA: alpha/beta hydrolase [Pseudonocardiaceae bacterium]|nr:alpha/beta hydrolase [Pseudonocardiaceae bacterium]